MTIAGCVSVLLSLASGQNLISMNSEAEGREERVYYPCFDIPLFISPSEIREADGSAAQTPEQHLNVSASSAQVRLTLTE